MPREKACLPNAFWWLNATQFLGAFNDNVFRFLIVFFLTAQATASSVIREAQVVTTSAVIFVVPFLLFSHAGGVLADRYSKRQIILALKYAELLIMVAGLAALGTGQAWLLYTLLFSMCTQSALFGPSKYGIIPELVPAERLSRANGYLAACSYLAIILGTFCPTFFLHYLFRQNFHALSVFTIVISLAGVAGAHRIAGTPAARRIDSRLTPWFVADVFRTVSRLRTNRYLLLAVLALAYFLFVAAFFQQNLLLYGKQVLGIGLLPSGYLFPLAALGIGLGAVCAGRLSGRNIEIGIVPIGAIGLTAGCLVLAYPSLGLQGTLLVILLLGISAGLFEVPLSAYVQYATEPSRRGEVLAAVNFLSFFGAALSAGCLYLLHVVAGLSPSQCFLVIGLLTGLLATGTVFILPDFLIRLVGVLLTRLVYRLDIRGIEHLPIEGGALLVANHVTRVDPLLLLATTQRRIRFVTAREFVAQGWLRSLLRLMRVIPIAPNDPPRQIVAALTEARRALEEGYLVGIFPEGALTRTGNLLPFRPGFERIVRQTTCPIIPIHIGGAWGSIFSYYDGKPGLRWPRKLPYPIRITFGAPMPPTASAAELRLRIQELSVDAVDAEKNPRRLLPLEAIATARRHWFQPAIRDTTGKELTFGHTLVAARALADILRPALCDQRMIGLLLPASVGAAVANLAVSLLGRTAVNLNFTASPETVASAMRQCALRTILTSRVFLEKVPSMAGLTGLVYLEDLLPRMTAARRLCSALRCLLLPSRWLVDPPLPGPDDPVTVIFSSGSSGDPKGVLLSHHNILSNIESFRMVLRFTGRDRMCAALPFFHSFGYTCTLWCPLITGFYASYHPNPLDAGTIAKMVREQHLTILLATPTFLLSYFRRAKPEDFRSLRWLVVGAEKLKPSLADAFAERFGIRPLEGYGATELSPVVAVNTPDVPAAGVVQVGTKPGSVGHPLPGIAVRVVDPETRETLRPGEEGLLLVKGPNVMLGYLGQPEKTAEVLRDGWYETGDLVRVDEDGFLYILDRVSRFSKIGGEMVSHLAIEENLHDSLKAVSRVVCVTGAPDEKKGEQLVLFYTDEAGGAERLQELIRSCDLPNLWKPKPENLVRIDSWPTLGTGKLDLRRLREMAREWTAGKRPPPPTRGGK